MARQKRVTCPCLTCRENYGCQLKLVRIRNHEENDECPLYIRANVTIKGE